MRFETNRFHSLFGYSKLSNRNINFKFADLLQQWMEIYHCFECWCATDHGRYPNQNSTERTKNKYWIELAVPANSYLGNSHVPLVLVGFGLSVRREARSRRREPRKISENHLSHFLSPATEFWIQVQHLLALKMKFQSLRMLGLKLDDFWGSFLLN